MIPIKQYHEGKEAAMATYTDMKQATPPAAAAGGRAPSRFDREHLHFDRANRVWWRHLSHISPTVGQARAGGTRSSGGIG